MEITIQGMMYKMNVVAIASPYMLTVKILSIFNPWEQASWSLLLSSEVFFLLLIV